MKHNPLIRIKNFVYSPSDIKPRWCETREDNVTINSFSFNVQNDNHLLTKKELEDVTEEIVTAVNSNEVLVKMLERVICVLEDSASVERYRSRVDFDAVHACEDARAVLALAKGVK